MVKKILKVFIVLLILFGVIAFVLYFNLEKNDYKYCDMKKDSKCKKADTIVVLSGGDTSARTRYGIKIFKLGYAKNIIMSGAAKDKESISNAEAMRNIATEKEVSYTDIILEEKSKNTHENAVNVAKIIKDNELKSIILVTSGYHQLRAYKEFRSALPKGVEIYNAPVPSDNDWSSTWFLTPRGWELAVKEFVASRLVKVK